MEVFYATVVACWIGIGCFFGQVPETFNEPTCGTADVQMFAQLSKEIGQPKRWEFSCITESELDVMVEEYGVVRDPG